MVSFMLRPLYSFYPLYSMLSGGQNLFGLGDEERNGIEHSVFDLRSVKGKTSDGKLLNQTLIMYHDAQKSGNRPFTKIK